MSGWDAKPTPNSGWEANGVSPDWNTGANPASAPQEPKTAAFDTKDLSAALPNDNIAVSHSVDAGAMAAAPSGDSAANGWVKPEEYDYGEYATSGGKFDGNAAVYHWDGEEGDLGPEFPQLEAELFGPPERRELPQGIDFTKWVPFVPPSSVKRC